METVTFLSIQKPPFTSIIQWSEKNIRPWIIFQLLWRRKSQQKHLLIKYLDIISDIRLFNVLITCVPVMEAIKSLMASGLTLMAAHFSRSAWGRRSGPGVTLSGSSWREDMYWLKMYREKTLNTNWVINKRFKEVLINLGWNIRKLNPFFPWKVLTLWYSFLSI